MSRKLFTPALLVAFFALCGVVGLRAQVVTYTWTGLGADDYWDTPENWTPSTAYPSNYTTDNVVFGNSPRRYVRAYTWGLGVYGLTFAGNTKPYYVDGNPDGYITLSVGAGGITYTPAQPVESVIEADFEFVANQTWNIASGSLLLKGYIYDGDSGYVFTKTGAGTLILGNYYNDFDYATINLNNGRLVVVGSNYSGYRPLGYADLIIGPATGGNNPILVARQNYYDSDVVTLDNSITLNGALTTENKVELHLTGPLTLNADTTVKSAGAPLFITGSIADGPTATPAARKLTVDSPGWVILEGANTYSGGTHVANGVLVFASVDSLPALPATNALSSATTGYIGFGDDGTSNAGASLTNPQGLFLDRFNKSLAAGTIGFDTDPNFSVPNTYAGAMDLTGFSATARLGSATRAILGSTAVITPQGSAYRFGGGGGWLQVDSPLTGARSLVLDSPAARPLTLRVTSSGNNYSGGTSVTNSALILGSNGTGNPSFPTGAADITINAGGYVGFEFWEDVGDATFVASSLAKINPASVGAFGFDNYSLLYVPIDLSGFTNALYLGTSTWGNMGPGLTLAGTITPAGGVSAPYRFAGYKGGDLEIASTLTGANGVHIGDPSSPATFGDYLHEKYSTVALSGNNSGLTGNVTLYGGELKVGQSNGVIGTDPTNALGSGTLVVTGMTLPVEWQGLDSEAPAPQLGATTEGLIIPNNVTLNTDLNIAPFSDFTLTGKISGPGELYLEEGDYTTKTRLALGNDANDFSGGVYLSGYSQLDVNADHALGTGPLGFGNSSSALVYFNTTAPVIGGLMSKEQGDYASLYATQTNTVLTINQSFDSQFLGEFRSDAPYPADNLRIVKAGAGTLRMEDGGMNFYHGTTEASLPGTPEVSLQVNQGTLVINSNFYLETYAPTVWVHGGTLALDSAYLLNPIVIDNGGRVTGSAQLGSASVGVGATLAPGLADTGNLGMLHFANGLTLAGGGTLEANLANFNGFASDTVTVDTGSPLAITATPADKFTLKAITLGADGNPGILTGIGPSTTYSWMLITGSPGITGFDANAFTLDVSQFQTNGGTGLALGTFSVSLAGENNQLMLNLTTFAGIPEPSTYALLVLGLGFLGLTAWRRSRRGA